MARIRVLIATFLLMLSPLSGFAAPYAAIVIDVKLDLFFMQKMKTPDFIQQG